MQLHCLTVGPFAENTYLLSKADQALIIDPGFMEQAEYEKIKNKMGQESLSLQGVVLTHAHVDHVLGLQKVLDDFDVPVYLSKKDRYLWDNFPSQASRFGFRVDGFSVDPKTLPIKKGWEIGNFVFDTFYTPGHAPDHVSLYSKEGGLLIAGDVLFKEGIGRTDLYKGDFNVLEQSIREKLYPLPEDTVVYPGHGPETTIGHEKQANPFVKPAG
ncbi:MBL fold metallo-hydrolase [Fodinibius saliphilus]|uniref:MBL fold metallo-hydrolase n=1 Tax=Fodinibius saliphilus TaxID=1920650 RepID=UPI001107DA9D|nr:MBL fold metallo-hydrolase [Fodinibius saliphilus]